MVKRIVEGARRAALLGAALLGVAACGRGDAGELEVYGAASLREVLDARAVDMPARISTGGSNLLLSQLLAGADADVLVVASPVEIERAVAAGLVASDDVRKLFENRLVVVRPAGSAQTLDDFWSGAGRVALAQPDAVPAGRYARQWLRERGVWADFEERVVKTSDVRAALAAVASGGVSFGVVYATDAATTQAVEVVHVVADGPRIEYFGAALKGSDDPVMAHGFVLGLDAMGDDAVATAGVRTQLAKLGFVTDTAQR